MFELVREVKFETNCPGCNESIVVSGEVDLTQMIIPQIQAGWLRPGDPIWPYKVTTESLLKWLNLQVSSTVPGANVTGISLMLGDPRKYGSQGQFTELLVAITGALKNNTDYTWAERDIIAATDETKISTPIDPMLEKYMFDEHYLEGYIRKGDYERRNKLKRRLGIGDEALYRIMKTSQPQIAQMSGERGPIILVGLDVMKMMAQLFATKEELIPETDENGNQMYSDDGNPLYQIQRDKNNNPILRHGKVQYLKRRVGPGGSIKLVDVVPISEFEVEYLVYYKISEGRLHDDRIAKEYLIRRAKARKR